MIDKNTKLIIIAIILGVIFLTIIIYTYQHGKSKVYKDITGNYYLIPKNTNTNIFTGYNYTCIKGETQWNQENQAINPILQ